LLEPRRWWTKRVVRVVNEEKSEENNYSFMTKAGSLPERGV
jgi:hypothetical protein